MSATFDRWAFDSILGDIESYIGYLKGNELVWEYMTRVKEQSAPDGDDHSRDHLRDYLTPCPDSRFKFRPHIDFYLSRTDRDVGGAPQSVNVIAEIEAGCDQSWHNGQKWAAGIADQARSITDQITSPDVAALVTALEEFQEGVLTPLGLLLDSNADLPAPYQIPLGPGESAVDDDWANLGGMANAWHGSAADEFRDLYQNLGLCISSYSYFAGLAAMNLTTATCVIASAQAGLMRTVKDIRTKLEAQLERWVGGVPPADDVELPWWILDLLPAKKIFDGVRLLAKAALDPKAVHRWLVDIRNSLVSQTAKPLTKGEDELFRAANAEEILGSLSKVLRDSYLREFHDALKDLAVGGADHKEFLSSVQDMDMWFPPKVADGSLAGTGDEYPA